MLSWPWGRIHPGRNRSSSTEKIQVTEHELESQRGGRAPAYTPLFPLFPGARHKPNPKPTPGARTVSGSRSPKDRACPALCPLQRSPGLSWGFFSPQPLIPQGRALDHSSVRTFLLLHGSVGVCLSLSSTSFLSCPAFAFAIDFSSSPMPCPKARPLLLALAGLLQPPPPPPTAPSQIPHFPPCRPSPKASRSSSGSPRARVCHQVKKDCPATEEDWEGSPAQPLLTLLWFFSTGFI